MIVIRRPREALSVFRRIRVSVDGAEVGRLRPGESASVAGTGAEQVLRARLDRVSAPPLTVRDRADRETVVEVRHAPGALIDFLVRPARTLMFEVVDDTR